MKWLFSGKSDFNEDISNWDTSSVTSMDMMFSRASAFNQPIGNWNTASVTDMSHMFWRASSFNQDIGNWNTASVTDMRHMFSGASAFNQNLCAWRDNNFPYENCGDMFANSDCTFTEDPTLDNKGPFCASDCTTVSIIIESPSSWDAFLMLSLSLSSKNVY